MLKNLPAGNLRDTGSIPGSERSPGGGHSNPLQYSCLEYSMDRGAWQASVHGIAQLGTFEATYHTYGLAKSWTRLSDFTFTFHFHALEKEMAAHPSVLAWRIPGTVEPGGLPSMRSHRVGYDWSDLAAAAAAAAAAYTYVFSISFILHGIPFRRLHAVLSVLEQRWEDTPVSRVGSPRMAVHPCGSYFIPHPSRLLTQQGRSAHAGSCGPPWRWHYQELCEA